MMQEMPGCMRSAMAHEEQQCVAAQGVEGVWGCSVLKCPCSHGMACILDFKIIP